MGAQLTLTQGYDEISSFSAVTAHMDEANFEKYTLLAVYVPSSSCSYRYGINHVWVSGETLCIHVQSADAAADGDNAVAGWLLTAGLEKEVLAGITTFDADLNNLSDKPLSPALAFPCDLWYTTKNCSGGEGNASAGIR